MKTILVTGFEPFGGQRINPSWVAVDMLPEELCGVRIIKRELPVEWDLSIEKLKSLVFEFEPSAVMCVGQAGGNSKIEIERVAINLRSSKGADNAGVVMKDAPVVAGAPAAYFQTLPYEQMLENVTAAGIDAEYSLSAGAYVCNNLLYGALHFAATEKPAMAAGFVHVPYLPQQVEYGASMPLDKIAKGILCCAQAVCDSVK